MKSPVSKKYVLFIAAFIFSVLFAGTAFATQTDVDGMQSDLPKAVISEFDGKRIGVEIGSTQEAKVTEVFKDPEVFYYNSFPDAVLALTSGRIDAFFIDDTVLRYAAGETENTSVLIAGDEGIYAAPLFQKTERGDLLRSQYNKFLAAYKESGRLDEISKKWLDGPEEVRTMDTFELPNINGVVSIATEFGYAPQEYVKDGELVGFEAEILREFCKQYGYRPEFYNTSFDSIIVGVYTGKFDIGASGFTITEERKKSVNFGDPFVVAYDGLLVRNDGGWTGTGTEVKVTGSLQTLWDGFCNTFIKEGRWKLFASGVWVTFLITLLSVLFGTIAGFGMYLLCRNGNRFANAIVNAVNWFVTGMPLVVFLMVLFYVIFARSGLDAMVIAVIGFSIVFALTMFHLMKSGEKAISRGQKEAAYVLGYSDMEAFIFIILPQAALHFLPAYQAEVISLLKATAIVGYITVMDVTKIGDLIRGRTYEAVFPLLAVVVAYFLLARICKVIVRIVMKLVDTKSRPKSKIMKGVVIR